MEPRDRAKTAFVCHAGHFQFTSMPFGVRNTPAIFQSLMEKVLRPAGHCSKAYRDDVVIFSDPWEDHVKHDRLVVGLIKKAGLTINPAKCRWIGAQLRFLGHVVRSGCDAIPELLLGWLSRQPSSLLQRQKQHPPW